MIKSYRDLNIYKDSYDLAIMLYKITQRISDREQYDLGSQIRRAATSVPMNIAEGYGKKESVAEFKRFLRMAAGSVNEMEVLLDMIKDLGYLKDEEHQGLRERYEIVGKQIHALIKKWE